jgi:hypothetical protein
MKKIELYDPDSKLKDSKLNKTDIQIKVIISCGIVLNINSINFLPEWE